jgi:tetratricopeptide (TPR) repeat protein
MEAAVKEYSGRFVDAIKIYDALLQLNPTDVVSWKRKAAVYRTYGQPDKAITEMNALLAKFPGEIDCWQQLADIYLSIQQFHRAAYCYEELLLSKPHDYWINLKYGELLYSIGGLENLTHARKYLTHCIILNPNCVKAYWGLIQTCVAIRRTRTDDKIS